MKREREERQKRYREEEARRYEARLREIDEKRWNKFREYAVNWDQRKRLLAFLGEVEARLATEGDVTVSNRTFEGLGRVGRRKRELSIHLAGLMRMCETIAKAKQWS